MKKIVQYLTLDNIFLMFCFVLFSVFFINTYQQEEASLYMLPRILCIFGVVMIGLMSVSSFFSPNNKKAQNKEDQAQEDGLGIGYSIVFTTVYFFAINLLGFILTTGLAITGFAFLMGYRNKKVIILLSIIIPLILHLAFVTLLKSSFPSGIVEHLFFE